MLKNIFEYLLDFILNDSKDNEVEIAKAKYFIYFWVTIVILSIAYTGLWLSQIGFNHYTLGFIVATFLMVFTSLPIHRYINNSTANIMLCLYAFGLINCAGLASGGPKSPIIIWLAMAPLLSGALHSIRLALALTLISFANVAIIFFLFLNNAHPMPDYSHMLDPKLLVFRTYFGLLITSTVIIIVHKKFVNQSMTQKEKQLKQNENLIRVMGHDIDNPLTIILGKLKMIEKKGTQLDDKLKEDLKKVVVAAEQIKEIIESVKDEQAIQSGKKEFEFVSVNLKTTFEKLPILYEDKLSNKKIKLIIESIDPSLNILADVASFSNQILSNVLSNAIKFSHENSEIKISASDGTQFIDIKITDTGVGIPKNLLDKLFDHQKKTNRLGTSGEKGTGFGMPLVKVYMDKFGGEISVESISEEENPQNHGTTFTLRMKKA